MVALVIDDDARVRHALSDEIRAQLDNHRVLETDCNVDALRALQEARPEVLFLDLSCAGRIDLRCYRVLPPAIVILSASNQDSVRDLRQAGLSAWMKPEVFSRLSEILRWAGSAQTQPDYLCDQWALTLLQLGYRSAKDTPQVLAFNGEGQMLIDGREILAASSTGYLTRIVLADGIVSSPHGLDFLAKQLHGCGLVRVGNRLLISRAHPWRTLVAFVKLSLRKPFQLHSRGTSPVLR